MKKDNRGMSLVEIIIVIAILSTLTALVTMGLSSIFEKPAEECARKLTSTLQSARTTTMGKRDTFVSIYKDDDDNIMVQETVNGTAKPAVKVGESSLVVTYTMGGSDGHALGGASSPLVIKFDRSNGSLVDKAAGCSQIKVSSRSGETIHYVDISYMTGRVEYR